MKNDILLKSVLAFCVSFLLLTFVDLALPNGEEEIYDSIVRLHVIANSDSEFDQSIKLEVRDEIISLCENEIEKDADIVAAAEEFERAANRVLAENNIGYVAHAVFGEERYPTREYDGISFPAGTYKSLRIVLGEGEGKNWWCVLFPPLCLSAATAETQLSGVGIDTRSYNVYTGRKYVIRFRLLEMFS